MTASQTLAQSLSASPSVTSYPTTLFSLPPPYHYEVTDLSSYTPTLSIFSLYDKVLRRPVEPASKSGQTRARLDCPLSARSGLMHRSKQYLYSMTSSARVSNDGGTVSPSALAVLRL